MTRRLVIHNHLPKKRANDTWYHAGQVNGYYILEGAVGDKGRWLVRNGNYDIVKTASSKEEATSFAKKQPNGGAMREAADSKDVELVQYNSGKWGWKMPNGKIVGPYPATAAGKAQAEKDAKQHAERSADSRDWTPGPGPGEQVVSRSGKSVLWQSKTGGYGVFHPDWGTMYTNNSAEANAHYRKTLSPRSKEPAQSHGELYTAGEDRDFRGVVNRDAEERNRAEAYRKTGITTAGR